mmetsp:Transcript_28611/g.92406  ORF Transcript_28611/g.92406 Transcript_28611/m.92406 type:complete len:241 (+) Transcript_28611:211-933(+)
MPSRRPSRSSPAVHPLPLYPSTLPRIPPTPLRRDAKKSKRAELKSAMLTMLLPSSAATAIPAAASPSPPSPSLSIRATDRRTERMAASLVSAASSAPEKVGVPAAMRLRLTSGASLRPRVCTRRVDRRPASSGRSMRTSRSKRPGRVSAGSSTSYLLVAPMTTTFLLSPPKPSMHASIWLSVCSTSSFEDAMRMERILPSASSSSTKTMQGATSAASLKSARMRAAPRPTKSSTKSEPEQ